MYCTCTTASAASVPPAMSLRSADLRFVLPFSVRTALVLGAPEDWRAAQIAEGLEAAGVSVARRATGRLDTDVVVATVPEEALRERARAHVVLGPLPRSAPLPTNSSVLPLLVRGDVVEPELIVPLDRAAALQYQLRQLASPRKATLRMRNMTLAALADLPAPVRTWIPARDRVTLVTPHGEGRPTPAVLRAAETLGIPSGASWLLSLGTGDDLQRAVFHVLSGPSARWVVKFSRIRGNAGAFVRDARGLGLARAAGNVVSRHAPELLGRLESEGLAVSVETAGQGRQLLHLLPQQPMALLDEIAAWTIHVGQRTAGQRTCRIPELIDLRGAVDDPRTVNALLDDLPPLPTVMQHNDLGSWNIISDGTSFTVVDWESARAAGPPLWDLLYFAADVLARVDGPADTDTLLRRTVRVFSGRSVHSARLWRWIQAAVADLGVPTAAVPRLAALCWIHHGRSAEQRATALAGARPAPLGHLARLASTWLAHEDLGPSWPSLRL